jgi:hypothetical protein
VQINVADISSGSDGAAGGLVFPKIAAIVVDQPVAQLASTISIKPGNVAAATGAPAAAGAPGSPQAPSVVAGQGTTGNGQACGCSCLCGQAAFPPNVGLGAFGGALGMVSRSVERHDSKAYKKIGEMPVAPGAAASVGAMPPAPAASGQGVPLASNGTA